MFPRFSIGVRGFKHISVKSSEIFFNPRQIFGQVFDQVFGQGFDQGFGEGKKHKYNVQYYPDKGTTAKNV